MAATGWDREGGRVTWERDMIVRLLDWFAVEGRDLPWRGSRDPYAIWISEAMLQQTQVKTVIPYWQRWMREMPDVRSLAAAAESQLLKLWEGLGYYRRVRHLQSAARRMVEEFGGAVPSELEALRSLPGVGRYTAGAVGSIAFDRPYPIVDGNVIRVLTRLRAETGDPRERAVQERLWADAEALVRMAQRTRRRRACSDFNQALMELGAIVCTPKSPDCGRCPVAAWCAGREAGRPERYPTRAVRVPTTARYYVVLIVRAEGRYWVRRRPSGEVNGGLWEFPNGEVEDPEAGPERFLSEAGLGRRVRASEWMVVRHAITRYRVTQRAYRVELPAVPARTNGGEWRRYSELRDLAFSSAHRRLVRALGALAELD
ncbi:MAG: A/G-specific adenine glycosylase [Verrucomicrobiae bacterium]|nr:A/G-specific adenine glycosylase [Verrucomicrobiae bacterium]